MPLCCFSAALLKIFAITFGVLTFYSGSIPQGINTEYTYHEVCYKAISDCRCCWRTHYTSVYQNLRNTSSTEIRGCTPGIAMWVIKQEYNEDQDLTTTISYTGDTLVPAGVKVVDVCKNGQDCTNDWQVSAYSDFYKKDDHWVEVIYREVVQPQQ